MFDVVENAMRVAKMAADGNPQGLLSGAFQNMSFIDAAPTTSAGLVDTSPATDRRLRLRAMPAAREDVYGPRDGLLGLLYETDGLLFPYTPSISVTQTVDYQQAALVHSNYDINAYARTPSPVISVTGKFTAQNQRECIYTLAALHFLRTVSKMHFGESDPKAGLPPPVLLLKGYGDYMYNDVRVVVSDHAYSLDDSVDLVTFPVGDRSVTLPVILTVQINLRVQQTPTALRKEFNLDQFRSGALLRRGGWL